MFNTLLALIFVSGSYSFADGAVIQGQVKVSSSLEKNLTAGSVLYVIARPKGMKAGPPLAVVRLANPKFPVKFEIGASNMMAGGEFKGPMNLTAKLSKSGDPMTNPGDLLGEAKKESKPGAQNVEITLSHIAP